MQQVSKTIVKQRKPAAIVVSQSNKFSEQPSHYPNVTMFGEETKHRVALPLYDLRPRFDNNWVAPNATVIGEVAVSKWASIWYNSVIRGDINRVTIGSFTSIGENCVVHTAAALPTGMSAAVEIGKNCSIGSGSTLYSCHIEDDVVIGERSVVLEGARIEKGAQLTPGSVVPPGRLIPTKQLWGGNPVVFIKDLNIGEVWANYTKSYITSSTGDMIKNEFTMWNSAYLQREANDTDADPLDNDMRAMTVSNPYRYMARVYI